MLAEWWMLQILDKRMVFPRPSLNEVIDFFSHSCLKMYCKIDIKHTLHCLVLTFYDIIGDLLPEWACHPPLRWDNMISPDIKFGRYFCLKGEKWFLKFSETLILLKSERNIWDKVMKLYNKNIIFLARLHFSAEELLLYPRRQRPRWRQRPRRRPHAKC